MKNTRTLWTAIAASTTIALAALVLVSCPTDGGNGSGSNFQSITVEIDEGITMTMNRIAPSTFTMGGNDLPGWTVSPERQVTLTQGFHMGIHQVTQDQFRAVMGANPSHFSGSPAPGEAQGRRPVENVSWYHAIAFANRLSILQGLTPVYTIDGISNTEADAWLIGNVPTSRNATWDAVTADWNANGFRLPTEAEWEFAARAGTRTHWSFGNDSANLRHYGWYNGNSDDRTREVGRRRPNPWGLYDMHGNVWEWVWDWEGTIYTTGAITDPKGVDSGRFRLYRGGGFNNSYNVTRSVFRGSIDTFSYRGIGFRVVRN